MEEFIDDDHVIVTSSSTIGDVYVRILSFVDKDLLELNSSVLLKKGGVGVGHSKWVVGVLEDEVESKTELLKLDKAPTV